MSDETFGSVIVDASARALFPIPFMRWSNRSILGQNSAEYQSYSMPLEDFSERVNMMGFE